MARELAAEQFALRPDLLPDGPVRVHPVYCLRADNHADSLLAVVLDEAVAVSLEHEYAHKGNRGWVNWDDLPLQGESGPCLDATGVSVVHLVSEGFCFDPEADVFHSGTALGVFTSLHQAEKFAAKQIKEEISVRTVQLDIPLELGF